MSMMSPTPQPTPTPDSTQTPAPTPSDATNPAPLPSALAFANNLDGLAANGLTHIDPLVQAQLALKGGSTENVVNTAKVYDSAFKAAGAPATTVMSTPETASIPDPFTAIAAAVHLAHGAPPISTDTIAEIQTKMQAQGYGTNLPISGTWDSGWNTAHSQYLYDQTTKPGVGNVDSMKFWGNVVHAISPDFYLKAAINYVKSVPAEVRSAVAALVEDAAKTSGGIQGALYGKQASAAVENLGAQYATNVENVGRNQASKINPTEFLKSNTIGSQLIDASNMAMLFSMSGMAKGTFVKGASEILSSAFEKDAAGATVKNFLTPSLDATYANAPKFTIANSLYRTEGGQASGFLTSKLLTAGKFNPLRLSNPILNRITPVIDALPDENGIYYKFRNALAQRGRIPLVQLGKQVQSAGSKFGLAYMGKQALQNNWNKDNIDTPYLTSNFNGIEGPVGTGLDILGGLVGAPEGVGKPSQTVGNFINKTMDPAVHATSLLGMDHILHTSMGLDLQDMYSKLGEENVNSWLTDNINKFAISHHADNVMKGSALDVGSEEYNKAYQAAEHEAAADPDLLSAARESLVSQQPLLVQHFYKNYNGYLSSFAANTERGSFDISDKDKTKFYAGLQRIFDLKAATSKAYSPEYRNLFFGSQAANNIRDLQAKMLAEDSRLNHAPFAGATGGEGIDPKEIQKALLAGKPLPKTDTGKSFPTLYHFNRNVVESAPDSQKLSTGNMYSTGIKATADERVAAYKHGNIYNLTHMPAQGEPAKILDLTDKGYVNQPSQVIRQKLQSLYGSKGVVDAKNPVVQQAREELGLQKTMPDGKIVKKDPSSYSSAYKKLRRLVTDEGFSNGQQILEAYRSALRAGGVLDEASIADRVRGVTDSVMHENNYAGVKYANEKGLAEYSMRPSTTRSTLTKLDPALSAEKLTPAYLVHNNINPLGSLGWAAKDTVIQQDAQNVASKAFKALSKAGYKDDVDAARAQLQFEARSENYSGKLPNMTNYAGGAEKIAAPVIKTLVSDLGIRPEELNNLDPVELASMLWRKSHTLASEAKLPLDAPEELKNIVAKADALGYRPVLGTDIGHSYEPPMLPQVAIQARTKAMAKVATALGFNMSNVDDRYVGNTRRLAIQREFDRVFNKGPEGGVIAAPGDNGANFLTRLLQDANLKPNSMQNALFGLSKNRQAKMVERMMGDVSDLSPAEIEEKKKGILREMQDTFERQFSLSDLSRKQFIQAAQRPLTAVEAAVNDATAGVPRYTKEEAERLYNAYLMGRAKAPSTYLGISKLEDMIRASGGMAHNATMSFLGSHPLLDKVINRGPIASMMNTGASLPNDLFRLRDKFRFDYNPKFSYERLVKTQLKAATQGVPATPSPLRAMIDQGTFEKGMNILSRVQPDAYRQAKDLEPFDKLLNSNDVFNIYNPAHNMAWQALHLEAQGMDDATIAKTIDKINSYGGRSAAERTVNTIFYPFSFNKSLYKIMGGYLLDNPGQAQLINAGLHLYNLQNNNNKIGQWFQNHMPLLQQLQGLNALSHGTGLGQLGGINVPYFSQIMNLVGPQQITPPNAEQAVKIVGALIPALGELNSLIYGTNANMPFSGGLTETAKVSTWTAENAMQHVGNWLGTVKTPIYQTTLSDQGQQTAGYALKAAIKTQVAAVIERNRSLSTADKITWPKVSWVPQIAQGKPVDSNSIDEWVNAKYPAYSAAAGTKIYNDLKLASDKFMSNLQVKDPAKYAIYNTFRTVADQVVNKLNLSTSSATDSSMWAYIQNTLRPAAIYAAEHDPQFDAFYKKFYASQLGPIEGITQ